MSIKSISVVSKKENLEFARTILDVFFIKQERSGPRIDPWGTPQLIFSLLVLRELISVVCVRFDK